MREETQNGTSRRDFLKNTGRVAAVSALAAASVPHVHAAENNTIQLALVGCGGRGTGAVADAFTTANQGPIKLVAMADAFDDRLKASYDQLSKGFADKVDVPDDRKFVGLDGFKKAMDCLKPGDIVILATPPAFRWVQFTYAIEKGLNVFMEKPVTVDGPGTRRMLKLAEEADKKNLKVGVGLMSRHSRALEQLADRIHGGEIGDLILLRGYRMHGPLGFSHSLPKPADVKELVYQIQRFHSFLWASGGCFSDFYIHIIDHCCWMKDAWPVSAQALGGRHYRQDNDGTTFIDQNFDIYSVEYTFADGTKFLMDGRCMVGCESIYNSFAHGSKGVAVVSKSGDCGGPSTTFKGLAADRANKIWGSRLKPEESNPYQNEWTDLVAAIRGDKPYNEARRGAEASLVTSMGRMAAHTGQVITFEQILNSDHEFAPDLDKLTMDSPAPVQADEKGFYPLPMPGLKKREY